MLVFIETQDPNGVLEASAQIFEWLHSITKEKLSSVDVKLQNNSLICVRKLRPMPGARDPKFSYVLVRNG